MSFALKKGLKIKNGKLEIIEKEEKLAQEIIKIVTTKIGSNINYPWYGSLVENLTVGNTFDQEFINSHLQSQIQAALDIIKKLQNQQISKQKVTPNELLGAVNSIKINQNVVDPRFLKIEIEVTSKAGRVLNIPINVGVT